MFKKWLKDENGQAIAEYALLIALIAILVVAAMKGFSTQLTNKFGEFSNYIKCGTAAC